MKRFGLFLKRDSEHEEAAALATARTKGKKPRIRCPKCGWQPLKSSRWQCKPPCNHLWNTFDTHGVCPGCHFQWRDTACLKCHAWSKHDDWYEQPE